MCIKIKIENIAKVKFAEIELNGITVIAGNNSTGKSTISKSLVSIFNSYSDLDQKVRAEKKRSIYSKIDDWADEQTDVEADLFILNGYLEIDQVTNRVLAEYAETGEMSKTYLHDCLAKELEIAADLGDVQDLYEDIMNVLKTPKSAYVEFIVEREFKNCFENQINTINSKATASIILQGSGLTDLQVSFENNEVVSCSKVSNKILEPVYIESKTLLDEVSVRPFRAKQSKNNVLQMLLKSPLDNNYTLEGYQENKDSLKIIKEIFRETVNGQLENNGSTIYFHDNELNANISINNLASGLKNYIVIQTLIENGELKRDGILIIDEPEVNLHPEWQLKFANMLVLLQKELNIKLMINTHSPYFVNALQCFSTKVGITSKTKYYLTDLKENAIFCEDVTTCVDKIYQKLAAPMLELQKLEYEYEEKGND